MRFTTLILCVASVACSSSESGIPTDATSDSVADAIATDAVPSSECPEGQIALFDGPGCDGSNKRCVPDEGPDACAAIVMYCGCDGVNHSGNCSDTEGFPYRYRGECGADAAAE